MTSHFAPWGVEDTAGGGDGGHAGNVHVEHLHHPLPHYGGNRFMGMVGCRNTSVVYQVCHNKTFFLNSRSHTGNALVAGHVEGKCGGLSRRGEQLLEGGGGGGAPAGGHHRVAPSPAPA